MLNMFIAILTEAYDKAKVRVFGDDEVEHESKYVHAVNMIPYFGQCAASVVKAVPLAVSSMLKTRTSGMKVNEVDGRLKPRHIKQLGALANNARIRLRLVKRDVEKHTFSATEALKSIQKYVQAEKERDLHLSEQLSKLTRKVEDLEAKTLMQLAAREPKREPEGLPPLQVRRQDLPRHDGE